MTELDWLATELSLLLHRLADADLLDNVRLVMEARRDKLRADIGRLREKEESVNGNSAAERADRIAQAERRVIECARMWGASARSPHPAPEASLLLLDAVNALEALKAEE